MDLDAHVRSRLLRWAIPLSTLVLTIATGVTFGLEIAVLVLAAGALAGVIALLWSSVQSLTGESPLTFEEALSMGAPSTEEEQKRAVLRALKDLEYERSVGKISAEDYQLYSARYRAEAKRLMQAVDESLNPARQKVEELVRQRLERANAAAETPATAAEGDSEDGATASKSAPENSRPDPTPESEDAEPRPAKATAAEEA